MAELFLFPEHREAAQAAERTTMAGPPDAAEREQALDIRRSWIVEAPAGSGKTGLLIQRYLKLLADETVTTPEQVLAITFTNKATAELRERVVGQLERAALGEEAKGEFDRATRGMAEAVLERDRLLGWDLGAQPGRLNIRTIDSVCAEISRSLPVLSGSGGRQSPVEDAGPLFRLAARRTFALLGGADAGLDAALRLMLVHRDGDLANCERLLAEMLMRRDQWADLVPLGFSRDAAAFDESYLDGTVLPRLERALELVVCSAITRLAQTIPQSLLERLTRVAAEMAHLEGYKGETSPIAICSGKDAKPGLTAEDLAHWRALMHLLVTPSSGTWRKSLAVNHLKVMVTKFEKEQITALIEELRDRDDLLAAICALGVLPPARYPADQWVVAKALFRVLSRALVELKLVFAERGECDFTEIALAARFALGRGEDAVEVLDAALGMRLQHLLVDEMQDTSSSQYELIERLTEGWDGYSQTVFLVGDPKQSIYLFRQARVERFLRTMRSRQLGELPLGCLRLTANFRSQAGLVEEFNGQFEQVFPADRDALHPEEVPFVAAAAVRATEPGAKGLVWHPRVMADSSAARAQRRDEAVGIRRIIEEWRDPSMHPLPSGREDKPWKIAVLIRSRSHAEELVRVFRDPALGEAIPYRAVEIDGLSERQEVQDLFALTRALLHPADRVAWLAVLRAPWCGFGLEELYTLTGADEAGFAERSVPELIRERGDLLGEEAIERLERLWPIFEAAAAMDGRVPVAERVERTWRSLGGDCYATDSELANARRYLELLDEIEEQNGEVDVAVLESRLGRLYAEATTEEDAVDLLTIHKAKGLEWDLVLVPGLDRIAGRDRTPLLSWLEVDSADEDAAHVLLAPIHGKGEESTELRKWINGVNRQREDAERKRLLYVVCTRAREELHLFAAPSLTAKGEIHPRPDSLLKSAWPAVEEMFVEAASAAVAAPLATAVAEMEEGFEGLALAAASSAPGLEEEEAEARVNVLLRLPVGFDPEVRYRGGAVGASGVGGSVEDSNGELFARPDGAFAARAMGNAVHAFLDLIAERVGGGETVAAVLAELPSWTARVTAVLRAEGLPPAQVERLAQRVLLALQTTLQDAEGAWLLGARRDAASEFALTAVKDQGGLRTIRVDRMFYAGAEPLTEGDDCLWIVDYKTASHGAQGVEEFLRVEREKYAPQLEGYARVLAERASELRLALYYPMLPKLIWWKLD
jgi:ATP-dependent helicase/nuclease subunit A